MELLKVYPNLNNQVMENQQFRGIKPKTELIIESKESNDEKPRSRASDLIKRKTEGEKLNIGEEKLIEMIEKASKALFKPPTSLRFSTDEETKETSIKIINTETQEVIKEISPMMVSDLVVMMWDFAGVFVDERI